MSATDTAMTSMTKRDIYVPLKEAFWDEWEEKSGFWGQAEKALDKRA